MDVTNKVRAEQFVRKHMAPLGLTKETKARLIFELSVEFNSVMARKDRVWSENLQAACTCGRANGHNHGCPGYYSQVAFGKE